jgi:hypothetical protein
MTTPRTSTLGPGLRHALPGLETGSHRRARSISGHPHQVNAMAARQQRERTSLCPAGIDWPERTGGVLMRHAFAGDLHHRPFSARAPCLSHGIPLQTMRKAQRQRARLAARVRARQAFRGEPFVSHQHHCADGRVGRSARTRIQGRPLLLAGVSGRIRRPLVFAGEGGGLGYQALASCNSRQVASRAPAGVPVVA